jgi:protein ImuB
VVGVVYGAPDRAPDVLVDLARSFSPRFEVCETDAAGPREIVLDLDGLTRLFGDARSIGEELRRAAADRGVRVRVAIAGTRTAARLLVRHRAGLTVVEPGTEAAALALLPIALLDAIASPDSSTAHEPRPTIHHPAPTTRRPRPTTHHPPTSTLKQWGLATLGDFAALPADAVAARLGQDGVEWQRLARGEDPRPLVPAAPEERFEQALDLEWPIDGLEPLSFVLGRLMEPLAAHLERRGRGAAVLHVRLHLVQRLEDGARAVHERSLQLPTPIHDARTLRTLALLDLESHPPAAAIDRVVVAVDPTPARVLQYSLLTRPLPAPEQISTLLARLAAVMGEGRSGSPAAVDAWQPGAFAMTPFAPRDARDNHSDRPRRHRGTEITNANLNNRCDAVSLWPVEVNGAANHAASPAVALRRFRFPVPARVRVEQGRPVRVVTDRRGLGGGAVQQWAGPWRTSGAWWSEAKWSRDEWDVALSDGAAYRVFRDRDTDQWFVEGVVD